MTDGPDSNAETPCAEGPNGGADIKEMSPVISLGAQELSSVTLAAALHVSNNDLPLLHVLGPEDDVFPGSPNEGVNEAMVNRTENCDASEIGDQSSSSLAHAEPSVTEKHEPDSLVAKNQSANDHPTSMEKLVVVDCNSMAHNQMEDNHAKNVCVLPNISLLGDSCQYQEACILPAATELLSDNPVDTNCAGNTPSLSCYVDNSSSNNPTDACENPQNIQKICDHQVEYSENLTQSVMATPLPDAVPGTNVFDIDASAVSQLEVSQESPLPSQMDCSSNGEADKVHSHEKVERRCLDRSAHRNSNSSLASRPSLTEGYAPKLATANRAKERKHAATKQSDAKSVTKDGSYIDPARAWKRTLTKPVPPVFSSRSRTKATSPQVGKRVSKNESQKDLVSSWTPSPTVPKSPRLSWRARSPTPRDEDSKDVNAKVPASSWTKKGTKPQPPRLHHTQRREVHPVSTKISPFKARPMPKFDGNVTIHLPRRRPSKVARDVSESSSSVSSGIVLTPTKQEPFELSSLVLHEKAQAVIQQKETERAKEDRARRLFKARPLSCDMISGATFVPKPSDVPRTTPKDVVTASRERASKRAEFDLHTMERLDREERDRAAKEKEKEEEDEKRRLQQWNEHRFKARSLPNSAFQSPVAVRHTRASQGHSARSSRVHSPGNGSRSDRDTVGQQTDSGAAVSRPTQYSPKELMKRVLGLYHDESPHDTLRTT